MGRLSRGSSGVDCFAAQKRGPGGLEWEVTLRVLEEPVKDIGKPDWDEQCIWALVRKSHEINDVRPPQNPL